MNIDVNKLKAFKTMPTLKSSDTEWINWTDFVISKYGTTLGKQIFISTWLKRGGKAANTRNLRMHLKTTYNIEIDESVWDKLVDIGGGITDTFANFMKIGKIAAYVVVGVTGVVVVGIAYNLIKNPSNIISATPYGRALKLKGGLKK